MYIQGGSFSKEVSPYLLEVVKLGFSGEFHGFKFLFDYAWRKPSLVRVYSVASDLLASFASKTSLFRGTARGDLATQGCNFAKRNMWIE